MKSVINRESLLSACQRSAPFANGKIKPMLANIKIDCSGGLVSVLANNEESSVTITIAGASVVENGSVLAPCNKLLEIVREVKGDDITIESKEDENLLTSDSSEFVLPSDNPEKFPLFKEINNSNELSISSRALTSAINATVFAKADSENSRFQATTGVFFDLKSKGKLSLVATDGRSMAAATMSVDYEGELDSFVVPANVLLSAAREFANTDEQITVRWGTGSVLFKSSTCEYRSLLVEGRFPPWNAVIPTDTEIAMVVNNKMLQDAVRQAAIITDKDSLRVNIGSYGEDSVVITTRNSLGRSHVEFKPKSCSKFSTLINPRFLLDYLKIIKDEQDVEVKISKLAKNLLFEFSNEFFEHKFVLVPLVEPKQVQAT